MSKKIQQGNNQKSSIDLTQANLAAMRSSLTKMNLPRLFYQLVVFVLDGSNSMNREGKSGRTKGTEVGEAITSILKRLQNSKNKSSFDVNIWVYSDEVEEILPNTKVSKIDLNQNFNPCNYVENGRTYLAFALEGVESVVSDYLEENEGRNTQALVIMLSDGALHDYEASKIITDRLKKKNTVTIASYLFEDKEWRETVDPITLEELRNDLENLSSSTTGAFTFFKSTVDPEEVRKHMIKSISVVSKIQS